MKALLDTNIIIHRENIKATNYSIGQLFHWLDKMHYLKTKNNARKRTESLQFGTPSGVYLLFNSDDLLVKHYELCKYLFIIVVMSEEPPGKIDVFIYRVKI